MDADKILGEGLLKGLEGFEGADHTTVLHDKVGCVVVCLQIEDLIGVQILEILVRFQADGMGADFLGVLFFKP